mmetsp:Transcript_56393/g.163586  ORF Transcript_56393/g.163586 Transcript_56393/m.163586 type:complete len:230 (-) Transcript_56393:158-847(-)
MPGSAQQPLAAHGSPPLAHFSATQGAAPGVRGPRTSQLHGWESFSKRSGPGVHAARHMAQNSFFLKHCEPPVLQHLLCRQSSPSPEQLRRLPGVRSPNGLHCHGSGDDWSKTFGPTLHSAAHCAHQASLVKHWRPASLQHLDFKQFSPCVEHSAFLNSSISAANDSAVSPSKAEEELMITSWRLIVLPPLSAGVAARRLQSATPTRPKPPARPTARPMASQRRRRGSTA